MNKIKIGIVGYGNIGRGVEQSIKRNSLQDNLSQSVVLCSLSFILYPHKLEFSR